jgi:hypothetical protein
MERTIMAENKTKLASDASTNRVSYLLYVGGKHRTHDPSVPSLSNWATDTIYWYKEGLNKKWI